MAAGRIILILAGLLLGLSLISSVTYRPPVQGDKRAPLPPPRSDAPELARTVELPGPGGVARTVRVEAGRPIRLVVSSSAPDSVSVGKFDRIEPVEAATPARFSLLPRDPGIAEVRLRRADRLVGRLVVRAPRP